MAGHKDTVAAMPSSGIPLLLFRPYPEVGEGPTAFLFRASEQNCLKLQFLERRGITFAPASLREIGCLPPAGQDPKIEAYTARIALSQKENPSSWIQRRARYCPACLRTRGTWLMGWEILFADACPTHGTWLLDKCGHCGRTITWRRHLLDTCSCGHKLSTEIAKKCPDAVGMLSRRLNHSIWPDSEAWKVDDFDGCTLPVLQRIIRLLGAYGNANGARRPQKLADLDTLDKSWPITSLAAEILANWPAAFHGLLANLQEKSYKAGEASLPKTFGGLYQAIFEPANSHAYAPLRVSFDDFVANQWPGALARRNRNLNPTSIEKGQWLALARAASIRNCSPQTVLKLAVREDWATSTRLTSTGRRFTLVRRRDVLSQTNTEKTDSSLKETAINLGLTKRRTRMLLRGGILGGAVQERFLGSWHIPQNQVEEFVEMMECLPAANPIPAEYVTLGHIQRHYAWSDRAFQTLFRSIAKDQIKPHLRSPGVRGLAAMAFKRSEISDWKLQNAASLRQVTHSVREAARALRIKEEVAYYLVREGILGKDSERSDFGRTAARIRESDLETFHSSYQFARDIAKAIVNSPKGTIACLADLGVFPIDGPGYGKCRQVIYRKDSALERAMEILCVAKGATQS